MKPTTQNLLGLTRSELSAFVQSLGASAYRGTQLFTWLYGKGARSFDRMTDLGKSFRSDLDSVACIQGITPVTESTSRVDGSTKHLFALHDGMKIESVLIPPASAFVGPEAAREDEQTRLTLCVSTQVGCPLDCAFCATATMGYRRNLTTGEIVDQVLQVKRLAHRKITNIVFMGMGEPMLNYENVMNAVDIIMGGMGIAARRITISTAGWADRITQMGDEQRRPKLAVSLHSAVDGTRTKLMPINKKYNLAALREALESYYARTKQRVTYEHIFFDEVNDTEKEVAALVKFARRVPCRINVIPFHNITFTGPEGFAAALRPSPRVEEIVNRLRAQHLAVMVRSSAGEDIEAACGQLAVKTEEGWPAISSRRVHQEAIAR
jgi:23S rRNA (adenine2503-C2)-methyltransferase